MNERDVKMVSIGDKVTHSVSGNVLCDQYSITVHNAKLQLEGSENEEVIFSTQILRPS